SSSITWCPESGLSCRPSRCSLSGPPRSGGDAVALEIEDGTGVPDADSYATAAELADRAAAYGGTVPGDDTGREVLLRRAAEAMNAMRWKGRRVSALQALAWPRSGVTVDGEVLPSDEIPAGIKYGQMALAAEIHADDIDPPESRKGA